MIKMSGLALYENGTRIAANDVVDGNIELTIVKFGPNWNLTPAITHLTEALCNTQDCLLDLFKYILLVYS